MVELQPSKLVVRVRFPSPALQGRGGFPLARHGTETKYLITVRHGRWVIVMLILAALLGSCRGDADRDASGSSSPGLDPTSGAPSPSAATPSPSSGSSGPRIRLDNLTSGAVSKEGSFSSTESAVFSPPPNTLLLVHLFTCCDLSSPPTLSGHDLVWELQVTHEAGEKRHWVYRAASGAAPASDRLTFTFAATQDSALWIVDYAAGTPLGNNGGDAIVQTAYQESQPNASSGEIDLAPFEDPADGAVVGFALCGSGGATDIVPEAGFVETAEVATAGANIIIDTFWRRGEDTTVSAEFRQDSDGTLKVQSWLFLAIELRQA